MASQWLRTLQTIDSHRKEQINKVRSLGHSIDDDASFNEISKYIGYNAACDHPDNAWTQELPWKRPEEWPNCFEILKTAPVKNSVDYPGIIILFKDTEDILDMNSVPFVKENSNQVCLGTACKGILTSDGAYYTNTTFSHTWDKSKDITINEGRFPGVYRWIILYYSNRTGITDLNLVGLPAIEIILGKIGFETGATTINASLIGRYDDSELNATNTLINLEFTEDFNITVMQWCYGVSGSGYSAMGKFDVLEHANLGPITCWPTNAYGSRPFNSCPRLVDMHCPSVTYLLRSEEVNFPNWPQIQRIYFPKFVTSNSFVIYYVNNLRELIIPGARAYMGYSSGTHGSSPDDINIQVDSISYNKPQALWTNNKASVNAGTNSNPSCYQGFLSLTTFDFNIQKTYSTSTLVTSNSTDKETLQCPRLRNVILYKDWNRRLDLSWAYLNKGCILEMFYNLADLTLSADPIYNPVIMLSARNKQELTEEEIVIATSKGWTVQ